MQVTTCSADTMPLAQSVLVSLSLPFWLCPASTSTHEERAGGGSPLTWVSPELDALAPVGDALGRVARVDDVALVARGAVQGLVPILSGAAGLGCKRSLSVTNHGDPNVSARPLLPGRTPDSFPPRASQDDPDRPVRVGDAGHTSHGAWPVSWHSSAPCPAQHPPHSLLCRVCVSLGLETTHH